MTHPTQTIAGVVALVAIVGVIGALRLTPDAGTDKLVDNGSSAFEATEEAQDRFGDEAIVVLAHADLQQLVLTEQLGQLLKLEACLSGNAPPDDQGFPSVCQEIAELDATRVVFGPATFLNQAATQSAKFLQDQYTATQQEAQAAAAAAAKQAAKQGLGTAEQQAAAQQAQAAVLTDKIAEFQDLIVGLQDFGPALAGQRAVRAGDRLRLAAPLRHAEVALRLPVPVLRGRPRLDPARARARRRDPPRGDRADPRGDVRRPPSRSRTATTRSAACPSSSRGSRTSSAARSCCCSASR